VPDFERNWKGVIQHVNPIGLDVVPQFSRLLVPRIQHEYGLFAHRHTCLGTVGKVQMMLQSIISLTVLALLAARAVNIL